MLVFQSGHEYNTKVDYESPVKTDTKALYIFDTKALPNFQYESPDKTDTKALSNFQYESPVEKIMTGLSGYESNVNFPLRTDTPPQKPSFEKNAKYKKL